MQAHNISSSRVLNLFGRPEDLSTRSGAGRMMTAPFHRQPPQQLQRHGGSGRLHVCPGNTKSPACSLAMVAGSPRSDRSGALDVSVLPPGSLRGGAATWHAQAERADRAHDPPQCREGRGAPLRPRRSRPCSMRINPIDSALWPDEQLPLQGVTTIISCMMHLAASRDQHGAHTPYWVELAQSDPLYSMHHSLHLITRWRLPHRVVGIFGPRSIPVAPP